MTKSLVVIAILSMGASAHAADFTIRLANEAALLIGLSFNFAW